MTRNCDTIYQPPVPGPPTVPVSLSPELLARLFQSAPPLVVQEQPYGTPPFRGYPINYRARVVVSVSAAVDAAANAGGAAMAVAEAAQTGVVVPVFVPAAVGAPIVVASFFTQQNRVGVLRTLRYHTGSFGGLRALRVSVNQSSRVGVPEQNFGAASELPVEAPIFVPLENLREVQVVARNLDPHSAYVLEVALDGWEWDIDAFADSLYAGLLRQDPSLPTGVGRPGGGA